MELLPEDHIPSDAGHDKGLSIKDSAPPAAEDVNGAPEADLPPRSDTGDTATSPGKRSTPTNEAPMAVAGSGQKVKKAKRA